MEEDKDMTTTNDNENKIMTTEYAYKTNRDKLYDRLTKEINNKLIYTVQQIDYCDGDCMLFFPDNYLAKHFAKQLRQHGWRLGFDSTDDCVIYVDVVWSIQQFIANDKSNDSQTDGIVESRDLSDGRER